MTGIPQDLQQHWTAVSPWLSLRNEDDYDLAVARLNRLLDEVGTDEEHPLYSLLDTLGTLVHDYEEQHHPMPQVSGADVLRFLMEEHGLTQAELSQRLKAQRRISTPLMPAFMVSAPGKVIVHGEHAAVIGCNARRVLAAVLQEQQCVVEDLVDGIMRDDADDATHGAAPKDWCY